LATESGDLRLSGFEPSARPGLVVNFFFKICRFKGILTLKKANAPAPASPPPRFPENLPPTTLFRVNFFSYTSI
jgi:hypothetical protein